MERIYLEGKKVIVREIDEADIHSLYEQIYKEEKPEWKKWDAPYFPFSMQEYSEYREKLQSKLKEEPLSQLIIEVKGEIIGIVGFYWEYKPTRWLEMGIVIYNPAYWNGGYGTEALQLYRDLLFENMEIGRVGLTTWSGNERMMKVAEKIGMKLEGRMRKCRYYNGIYYDSIRMGIIREEWGELREVKE
ncbi:GNAT family N-acetyltransferase [Bacillus cytotoxicus]|uniref:GNAT family N-acetyltransferase n=1 Tax=Bacillus cytotoxicus TaxID=580165 RepID=UPI000864411B|nr:GNAT family protein [Bacillus cytotoxicus]AWC28495.1 N-acetyltransferase [Bacillus cytotoxicus]AWC40121.1 N-acetyltransferase [Bacillus cytotoxicus]AWC48052.1 N-acetyltransferase [Bacillus cytotoxicus]AWC52563.1 N-acetyltransferase [Bacillus cytotoxicus]AWC56695.1 N-acetyltransferase [Bacillus cytotoxicus]